MQDKGNSSQEVKAWTLIHITRHALHRARSRELARFDILPRHAAALVAIKDLEKRGEPATPAAIARWLFREPQAISVLIKAMKKEGLVKKVRD